MKKNDWALIISTLLYSVLFYKQTAGINFFLFNIGVVGLLIYRDAALIKNARWLSVSIGALISSFFIFKYGSALAIWANLFSLAILSLLSLSVRSSFFMGIFTTLCSIGASYIFIILDWINRKKNKIVGEYKRPFYVKLFLILIPFLIAILFFFFYQTANPLFYEFTKDINLDFISLSWIFFTISGLLLMYGFFHNNRLNTLAAIDVNAEINLTEATANRKNFLNGLMRIDTERMSGIILFVMLNILLLLLNALDFNYLLFDRTLPEGITHKDFVHDGIGVLITSLIAAILIILFYFRGTLNFDAKNKSIKILAIIWIFQNVFMILSTMHRNNLYIAEAGLTYKRIGVYVYLLLTLIGLITTFIKIIKIKTNWYLFRINSALYYYIIVIACTVNWDVLISNNNIAINIEKNKKLDKYYLLDLSYKNLPQLMVLPENIVSYNDYAARDYYFSSRNVYFRDFKSGLHSKFYNFLEDYAKIEWQSKCLEKDRVYNDLLALKSSIKELDLSKNYKNSLSPIYPFTDIEVLDLSNNYIDSLEELSQFKKLKTLSLNSNNINQLSRLPDMPSLVELNVSQNRIHFFEGLNRVKNIKKLDLSHNGILDLEEFPHLTSLNELNLSGNKIKNLKHIEKLPSIENLTLSNMDLKFVDSFPQIKNLKSLDIGYNNLNYYASVLKDIAISTELSSLIISNNPINDIATLTNRNVSVNYEVAAEKGKEELLPLFPNLKMLNASSCSLKTIYTIHIYKSLENLDLSNNEIDNIMPLVSLGNLVELNLSNNVIRDLKNIKLLKNLKKLDVSYNSLQNISELSTLSKLEELNLSNTKLKDLSFVKGLTSLKYLDISENRVDDYTPIASLDALEEINITNCFVEDFSFLLKLKNLKKITYLNPDRKLLIKLSRALPDVKIETVLNNDFYPVESY